MQTPEFEDIHKLEQEANEWLGGQSNSIQIANLQLVNYRLSPSGR